MNIFLKLLYRLKGMNPEKLVQLIRISIRVSQSLKMIVENPKVGILVALSKNKIDDATLAILKRVLPIALQRLQWYEKISKCLLLKDNLAILQCIADNINNLDKEDKNTIYKLIAVELSNSLLMEETGNRKFDKNLNGSVAYLVENEYQKIKNELA